MLDLVLPNVTLVGLATILFGILCLTLDPKA
jgi:hypothetical protein